MFKINFGKKDKKDKKIREISKRNGKEALEQVIKAISMQENFSLGKMFRSSRPLFHFEKIIFDKFFVIESSDKRRFYFIDQTESRILAVQSDLKRKNNIESFVQYSSTENVHTDDSSYIG